MNKRILVIDDRPDLLDVVKNILEDDGYEVLPRQTPLWDAAEIEALHLDLILLAVTDVVDCVGRQTRHMLKHHVIPMLVLIREPEYFLEQDKEFVGEHITVIRSPSTIDDLTNTVHQIVRG